MPRIKRGVGHTKRRHNILKQAKGYRWGRKNKLKVAKTAISKAGKYAYRDRRNKKRLARRLWQTKLSAAMKSLDWNYSGFIGALKKAKIDLDRKVLADIAEHNPKVFEAIVKKVR